MHPRLDQRRQDPSCEYGRLMAEAQAEYDAWLYRMLKQLEARRNLAMRLRKSLRQPPGDTNA